MQANFVNGWREVLARVFDGFEVEYGLTPEWLVNPDTNRRLKLDYFFPELSVALRFVGMEGTGRKRRKSDDEVVAEENREDAREAVCRGHGVLLLSIDPDGEPRAVLRELEMGLARASAQVARSGMLAAQKQKLMPLLGKARQVAGEFTVKLTVPERLNMYAEMWWDRQAALATQAPAKPAARARRYEVGMAVEHTRFGLGQVTAIETDGDDSKVTVDFPDSGVRTFLAGLVGDKLLPR